MSDLSALKVGDEVAETWGWENAIATVERITPSGRIITSSGRAFNADGRERGSTGYNRPRIRFLVPGLRRKILKEQLVRQLTYMKWHTLSLDELIGAANAIGITTDAKWPAEESA